MLFCTILFIFPKLQVFLFFLCFLVEFLQIQPIVPESSLFLGLKTTIKTRVVFVSVAQDCSSKVPAGPKIVAQWDPIRVPLVVAAAATTTHYY